MCRAYLAWIESRIETAVASRIWWWKWNEVKDVRKPPALAVVIRLDTQVAADDWLVPTASRAAPLGNHLPCLTLTSHGNTRKQC